MNIQQLMYQSLSDSLTPVAKVHPTNSSVIHEGGHNDSSQSRNLPKWYSTRKAVFFFGRLKIDKLPEVTVEAMPFDQVTMTDLVRRQPHPYNFCMAEDEYNFFNSHARTY